MYRARICSAPPSSAALVKRSLCASTCVVLAMPVTILIKPSISQSETPLRNAEGRPTLRGALRPPLLLLTSPPRCPRPPRSTQPRLPPARRDCGALPCAVERVVGRREAREIAAGFGKAWRSPLHLSSCPALCPPAAERNRVRDPLHLALALGEMHRCRRVAGVDRCRRRGRHHLRDGWRLARLPAAWPLRSTRPAADTMALTRCGPCRRSACRRAPWSISRSTPTSTTTMTSTPT